MNKAKLKSAIIVILLVAAVTMTSVFSVFAVASEFILSAATTNVKRGESVVITVKTKDIADVVGGFNAYSGTLGYDSAVLSRGESKTSVAGWNFVYNPAANTFLGSDPTGMDFKKTDIDVFTVKFEVLESAPLGETEVKLTNLKITDSKFKNIGLVDKSIKLNIQEKEEVAPPKSSNNKLATLTTDGITLVPAFSPDTLTYNVTVENDVLEFNLAATVQDGKASIVSGTGNHKLNVGNNVIKVVVKAENGSERTYTINVNRKDVSGPSEPDKSNTNTLDNISVKDDKGNDLALSPKFDPNKPNYDIKVNEDTGSIDISGIPTDPGSEIISGGGNHVLKDGENVIDIVVRAEDGSERTYTITVDKPAKGNPTPDPTPTPNPGDQGQGQGQGQGDIYVNNSSSNNFITNLQGFGNLNEPFDKNVTHYTTTVGKEVKDLSLQVTLEDEGATYRIIGADNLKPGLNKVIIEVTASNGDVRQYVIDVYSSESESSALLSSISVGGYAINPGFREDVMFYTLYVANDVTTLGISATAKHGGASVNISGNNKLNPGLNYVKLSVTANGQMNTYMVEVIREDKPASVNIIPWVISGITGFVAILLLLILAYKSNPKGQQPMYYQAPQPVVMPQVQPVYYPAPQAQQNTQSIPVQQNPNDTPGYFKQ